MTLDSVDDLAGYRAFERRTTPAVAGFGGMRTPRRRNLRAATMRCCVSSRVVLFVTLVVTHGGRPRRPL